MSYKSKKVPYYALKEINSIWRNYLHLGKKQIVQKGFIWDRLNDENIFFLDKGSIALNSISPQGHERISLRIESGCVFNETVIFSLCRDGHFGGGFIALEESIIYTFPAYIINKNFLCDNPELLYNLLQSSTNKVSIFYSLLANTSGATALEVICRYIERLAQRYNTNTFTPHFSQTELAISVGLHRSTVCRIIKELREEGVLGKFTKDNIEILDRKTLQKYATGIS